MTPEHERQAAAVADRNELPSDIANNDRVAQNLARLKQLSSAYQTAAAKASEPRECLFRWRHLEVERLLDSGGFGEIFLAWDSTLKRSVALKLVPADVQSESRDRLMIAEAQRMARIRHNNVLAVHGADVADGRTGMWCDLIQGQTLEKFVAEKGPMPADQVVDLAIPLADALRQVHGKAMTHGDVKPANIMIELDGTPVLLDFGAVQAALADSSGYGSPLVMAPEQFADEPTSPASDRYSLGCTLHYALTGRYPIEADTMEQLLKRHQQRRTIDLSAAPRPWRKLLHQLLEPDPDTRIGAAQLEEQLQRMKTRKQRHRKQLALCAIMVSLAAGASAAGWAAYATKRDARRLAQVHEVYVQALSATSPVDQSGPPSLEPFYDNLYKEGEQRLVAYPKAQGQVFSLVGLGYDALGRPKRGLEAAQRALDLMRSSEDVSDYELADVWLNLAESLRTNEQFGESEQAAKAALALLDTSDHPEAGERRLVALNKLSLLYLSRGRIRESIQAHKQLLAQRIALHGKDSVRAAVDHFNLATSQHAVGMDQDAVTNYQRAEQLLKANGDEASVRMGFVMHGLAEAFTSIDTEMAQRYVAKARGLYAASLPTEHKRLLTLTLTELEIWRQDGQAQRVDPVVRELMKRPDLTDKQQNQMRSLLAAAQMDLEQWRESAELYATLATLDSGQFSRLQPYYAAALAYANYRADATEPSPVPAINEARQALAAIGHERTPPYQRMGHWLTALAGAMPTTASEGGTTK